VPLSYGDFDLCKVAQDDCCFVVLSYSYDAAKKSLVKMFFYFFELLGFSVFSANQDAEKHKKGRYISKVAAYSLCGHED